MLSGIENKEVVLSLIHGDFWKENILITPDNIYFIDYDRSSEYSFLEFDLINYFIFDIVYKNSKPSWDIFTNILNKENIHNELLVYLDKFYSSQNINDVNKLYIDVIVKLYILKTLYNNNLYLEGFNYLKWSRHRKNIERLLWN